MTVRNLAMLSGGLIKELKIVPCVFALIHSLKTEQNNDLYDNIFKPIKQKNVVCCTLCDDNYQKGRYLTRYFSLF